MIWYLLYPFRGTTEPPVLSATHPLRRAFYQHGTATARHWLAFILFSVAAAVLFCYPVVFLYENPTTGFSKLPYHVWTSARLFDGDARTTADVEIRQIWVHGSYMKALEQDVLLETLSIQETVVADVAAPTNSGSGKEAAESGIIMGHDTRCASQITDDVTWGFHSPLMFWNCSSAAVRSDLDILRTINDQTHRRSYLHLTLRPTSVFAGKAFLKNQVIAADALVITLFDRAGNRTRQHWNDRLSLLAKGVPFRWSMYPHDGQITQSRLYEFQQKPLSIQDNVMLTVSYLLMGLYVLLSLGKLRAVKSKVGLIVTVVFELAVSITASFSICGILQIDLARIPDAAYPFVVLVMGLENMFRLINAVLAQPAEQPITHRVATAVGEVGHLSLATAAQMLFILWLLSKVASGIAAFCMFAAIALVFDYALHLTFFLAVLSVDVRRMELGDSLDRANTSQGRRSSSVKPERQYWLDALLQGQLPFSSRIAGSAISISFILGLNMHFYESGSTIWSLVQSLRSMVYSRSLNQNMPFSPPPPINQARTPAAWLRIQDYRYAQEVLEFVRPSAHSIIARVYDPLTIVLHHSDRSGVPSTAISGFHVFWALTQKHLYPFTLAIIFSVATVTLLMQYMLWNELPEEEPETENEVPPMLSLAILPKAHRLDVIKLTGCGKGHLISVSLDRLISISMFDNHTHKYSLTVLSTAAMIPPLWPIVSIAIDDSGTWAAFCSASGDIGFWNLAERRMCGSVKLPFFEQQPCAFSLVNNGITGEERLRLIVVYISGVVKEYDALRSAIAASFEISQEKLVCAKVIHSRTAVTIVALNRSGRIRVDNNSSGEWKHAAVEELDPRLAPSSQEGKIKSITTAPLLSIFAAVRLRVVDLVDIHTKSLIYTFPALLIKGHSLQLLHAPRRECTQCHSTAVHSISLVYTDFETQFCVMRTYARSDDHNDLMCLGPKLAGRACNGLSSAKEALHTMQNPGSWEATGTQSVAGIRTRPSAEEWHSESCASGVETTNPSPNLPQDLKHRSEKRKASSSSGRLLTSGYSTNSSEDWEVWTLSAAGEVHTLPLDSPAADRAQSVGEDDLFVASPGPIVRLGNRSVAMGFGNRVKVVMIGNERFDQDGNVYQDLAHMGGTRRKRPGSRKVL